MSLQTILLQSKTSNNNDITHTRIGKRTDMPETNIYAGKYNIQNTEQFYETYYNSVIVNDANEYLTEKQSDKSIAVDFDFRYNKNITTRQHNKNDIDNAIECYLKHLTKYVNIDENTQLPVYIFEKPNINTWSDDKFNKDGIHMIIGLKLNRIAQKNIRLDILKDNSLANEWKHLPIENDFNDVLDKAVSDGSANWQMYGSKKPDNEAYKLTHHYKIGYDIWDKEFTIQAQNTNVDFELFKKMSVQYDDNISLPLKHFEPIDLPKSKSPTSVSQVENIEFNKYSILLKNIIENIKSQTGNRNEWLKIVGWCKTHCNFNTLIDLIDENYKQETANMWSSVGANSNLYLIEKIAKDKCPDYYKKWCIEYKFKFKFNGINDIIYEANEDDFFQLYYKINEKNLLYQNKQVYFYYNDEWRVESDGLCVKNDMLDVFRLYVQSALSYTGYALGKNVDNKDLTNKIEKIQKGVLKTNVAIKKNLFLKNTYQLLINRLSSKFTSIEFDTGKDNLYNVHFKNGVYELNNKIFRARNYNDYITKYLPYNYIEKELIDIEKFDKINSFFKQIQPNEKQRNFTLGYLAYCLSGDISKTIFKVNIGYSAGNGKSTELAIHDKVMSIYCKKLDNRTFDLNYSKRHKHILDLLQNPIRLSYMEELDNKKMDSAFMKDFVDGKKIACEILFGTDVDKKIQAKLMTCSNKDFNIKMDEGILRRGKVQYYNSKFVSKVDVNEEKHHYLRDEHFVDYFDDDEYKNAYFHTLLKYYEHLDVPEENTKQFQAICEDNDEFLLKIDGKFEITKCEKDCISKQLIIDEFGEKEFLTIMGELKRLGCSYDKNKRANHIKGVFYGIKQIEKPAKCMIDIEDSKDC